MKKMLSVVIHIEDKRMKDFDNHKENNGPGDGVSNNISAKIRAFIAGLTPAAVFRYTLATSIIVVLAAGIIYHTATDSKHVNINKVDTATVVLSGSDNLGGIGPGEYKGMNYSLTNNSTSPAYVFIRIEEATAGLYEVVDTSGWVRVTAAEEPGQIILAYGTLGNMTPVVLEKKL